jgi:hypothetical protein
MDRMPFTRIPNEVLEFLGGFGISVESNSNSFLYFKYRLFPTKSVLKNCGNFPTPPTNHTDIFYDKFDDDGLLDPSQGVFYRERRSENGVVCVRQEAIGISSNCHCYTEVPWEMDHHLKPFLKINYSRRYSLMNEKVCEEIYLDAVTLPHLQMNYEVVSIGVKVTEDDNLRSKMLQLFSLAYKLNPDVNLQFNLEGCDFLLEDERYPIFPMYSKFMYALQMSVHFESYETYCQFDPIRIPLRRRVRVASEPENVSCECYDRVWVWTVDYQLHYFQTRLGHCRNKAESIDDVLQAVDKIRAFIFKDNSIQLVDQEVDPLCC